MNPSIIPISNSVSVESWMLLHNTCLFYFRSHQNTSCSNKLMLLFPTPPPTQKRTILEKDTGIFTPSTLLLVYHSNLRIQLLRFVWSHFSTANRNLNHFQLIVVTGMGPVLALKYFRYTYSPSKINILQQAERLGGPILSLGSIEQQSRLEKDLSPLSISQPKSRSPVYEPLLSDSPNATRRSFGSGTHFDFFQSQSRLSSSYTRNCKDNWPISTTYIIEYYYSSESLYTHTHIYIHFFPPSRLEFVSESASIAFLYVEILEHIFQSYIEEPFKLISSMVWKIPDLINVVNWQY